jgi:hypothetical protein
VSGGFCCSILLLLLLLLVLEFDSDSESSILLFFDSDCGSSSISASAYELVPFSKFGGSSFEEWSTAERPRFIRELMAVGLTSSVTSPPGKPRLEQMSRESPHES